MDGQVAAPVASVGVGAKASISTVATVFSVNEFEIPAYQREFSWRQSHVEDLFADLIGTFYRQDTFGRTIESNTRSEYFLGVIVTQVRDGGEADKIVDGQQRITSLIALMCALVPHLAQRTRLKLLSLIYRQEDDRFVLNVGAYNYYLRRFLRSVPEVPAAPGRAPFRNAAIERLEEAFNIFSAHLAKNFGPVLQRAGEGPEPKPGEADEFADWLMEKVFFAHVQDTDPYDEQRLFDRINTRGMPLAEGARFMSKVLSASNEGNAERGSRDWTRSRNTGLAAIAYRANDRQVRDPLEAEKSMLTGWLVATALPHDSPLDRRLEITREIFADPYDWILRDAASGHLVCEGEENIYITLRREFFPYVAWSKTAYGATNRFDPALPGFRHAQIQKVPLLDALIGACYFKHNRGRTQHAIEAMSDFLDLVSVRRGWRSDWKGAAGLRDLLLQSIAIVKTAPTSSIRPGLKALLIDAPVIDAQNAPSLTSANKTWLRFLLGRIAMYVETSVMGRTAPSWLMLGKGDEYPEIEHILSANYQEFRKIFGNDPVLIDQIRQRLGALTILTRKKNLEASNLDFDKRLPIYLICTTLTAAISPDAYDNRLRLRGRSRGAADYPFRPYDRILAEMVGQREELYAAIARDVWSLDRLWPLRH